MNKKFENWVKNEIKQHNEHKGMRTGRMSPLTHYEAKKGAKLAWDYQQKKIDNLMSAALELIDKIDEVSSSRPEAYYDTINLENAISKADLAVEEQNHE